MQYEHNKSRLGVMFPPLTFRQREIIVGNFAISAFISSTVIFSHSSITLFISVTVVTLSEARHRWILLLRIIHMRSTRLKSGELDTHSNFGMPCFSLSRHVKRAPRDAAPSSMSVKSGFCFSWHLYSGHIIGLATYLMYLYTSTLYIYSWCLGFSTLNFLPLRIPIGGWPWWGETSTAQRWGVISKPANCISVCVPLNHLEHVFAPLFAPEATAILHRVRPWPW